MEEPKERAAEQAAPRRVAPNSRASAVRLICFLIGQIRLGDAGTRSLRVKVLLSF